MKALLLPSVQAELCWREWRCSANLDRLSPGALLLLPMLAHCLPGWLANDPARGVLLGICRRCWSHNQLRLRQLDHVVKDLREAGIGPIVLSGSVAWMFLYRPALRPIESLELLIRREQVPKAADVVRVAGWTPARELAVGEEMDRIEGVWFDRGPDRLKLSWRIVPASPEIAAERERISGLQSVQLCDEAAGLLAPEDMLLHAFAGYRDPCEIDWRTDASQLLKSRPVNWRRMRGLLREEPVALSRARELRDQWGAAIPPSVFRELSRWEVLCRDYRRRSWQQRRSCSFAGFAVYLGRRSWRRFVRVR